MKNRGLILLLFLLGLVAVLLAIAFYFGGQNPVNKETAQPQTESQTNQTTQKQDSPSSQAVSEMEELSQKRVSDLRKEERLNLNMVSQLRSYQKLLEEIGTYAKQVEKEIDIIEEIGKEEFQEDVKLQASLFAGKKPNLVAKHLEEFRASRVGAILAKMKEKEASAVLDVWAKTEDPRVGAFYRETMSAYLNNKRRDMRPDLFEKAESLNQKTR